MPWLGFVLGALIGAYAYGFRGLVIGAVIGVVAGALLRQRPSAPTVPAAAPAAGASAGAVPALSGEQANAARIAALEQRLSALEAALVRAGVALPTAPVAALPDAGAPAAATPAAGPTAATAPAVPAPETLAAPRGPVRKGGAVESTVARARVASSTAAAPARPAGRSLWTWFTDGNTLVRVGIVILFFGVAFLLAYFAEHVSIPIELQFAGVAFVGVVLIGVGAWLRNRRRAYALALIGGGLGVLYLTAFAAFQLVPLLAAGPAFVLLAAIAVLAIVLALLFDSPALAALAALGGLLAPVLVATVSEPLPLFGYVAAVNLLVVGVAAFRAWRVVDLVGFLGTLLLGLWWGYEYYDPAYFHIVEPFLAGFFLAYVALPIVHAWRGAGERRVDAMLLFGVPIVAFALQALLVSDTRYGLAWTAAAVAVFYALLWRALRRPQPAGATALAAAFGALAVIFATLTVPLAVDARWTSALWAVEAAGVYWIGCREDRPVARGFALLLQVAAGGALLLGGFNDYAEFAFANRQFLGCAAVALAAFASVRFGDGRGAQLPATERSLLQLLFGWACAWWLGGGLAEIARHLATGSEAHAMLAWVVGSITLAVALARPLRWPRLDGTVVILLPALALALGHDLAHGRTSVTEYGWLVYPLAWALHFALLRRSEARAAAAPAAGTAALQAGLRPWLAAAHTFGALLLLGQVAWEAGEWTARVAPPNTAWAACAHMLPLALYLVVVARPEAQAGWPVRAFRHAYLVAAGTIVAVLLGLGFVALALLNPGDAQPLPYVPLLNPLELTLGLAWCGLFFWARADGRLPVRALYRWSAAGAFIVLNGVVARSVHHWLGVPWELHALLHSRPLQAALTLTWTVAALAAMVAATRYRMRALWLTGAGLLAAVVIKLFAIDLAALSGLSRVVAFLGVGALLLVIGYVAPLPPAEAEPRTDKPS
jgi:uncharacterized membrane protein